LVPAGLETDALTDFTDLLPTFAELGGADLPKDQPIDGVSFAPLLLGKSNDSPREWIMALGHGAATLDSQGVRGKNDYADRVIRDKRFKAWVGNNKEITELYDLKADPLERENLLESADPDALGALQKFRAVVDSTPDKDARPKYRKSQPLAWDRAYSGQDTVPKSKNRQRQKKR
jgi:arylsulfatase A-like enzyme